MALWSFQHSCFRRSGNILALRFRRLGPARLKHHQLIFFKYSSHCIYAGFSFEAWIGLVCRYLWYKLSIFTKNQSHCCWLFQSRSMTCTCPPPDGAKLDGFEGFRTEQSWKKSRKFSQCLWYCSYPLKGFRGFRAG